MRQQFHPVGSYRTARKLCPWAAIIARVENGFIAFESVRDYRTWRRQL